MNSKYFCRHVTHGNCIHDWDNETRFVIDTITTMTTEDPFFVPSKLQNVNQNQVNDCEKDRLIELLMNELSMTKEHSEAYWQRKLENRLYSKEIGEYCTMRRETLGKHRFVTDLSNRNVLVEIKHHKDFRRAVGQVADYVRYKKRNGDPVWFVYILLFGDLSHHWSRDLWNDRVKTCEDHGILLRWLT